KKKYFIALILFICCISQQATAMHGLIFRAVQVITSGNLIGGGAMISFMRKKYYDNYNVQRGINEGLVIPASETVKRYVHKKLNECNISNSSEVPVIVVENPKETWAVFCDRVIQV